MSGAFRRRNSLSAPCTGSNFARIGLLFKMSAVTPATGALLAETLTSVSPTAAGCECSLSAYSPPPWDLSPLLPSFIYSKSWPVSISPPQAKMFCLRTRAPLTMEMPQTRFLVRYALPVGMRLETTDRVRTNPSSRGSSS